MNFFTLPRIRILIGEAGLYLADKTDRRAGPIGPVGMCNWHVGKKDASWIPPVVQNHIPGAQIDRPENSRKKMRKWSDRSGSERRII